RLARDGAEMLAIPAAFTFNSGKAHWHVLLRARAIETGCFVVAAAQCGTHADGRRTYGHALIVSPWGEIMAEAATDDGNAAAGANDAVIHAALDPQAVNRARTAIPSLGTQPEFS
ncbi:MAG: nitrilase-related carbon-nitrogen hydrolase, partial [Pseudomonadota bacterium]|nr:nitrilase-related carbon-nitrogen hydrolase [Pseudomonadota bacterium]